MKYPKPLQNLVEALKLLPGVGTRTAERFAFKILDWPDGPRNLLADLLRELPERISHCPDCGCLQAVEGCSFCHNPTRDSHTLCVLATARDVYAMEETAAYQGRYHVLGGLLSPMEGKSPDSLAIASLLQKLTLQPIREVILALDSSLEGDATALYLKDRLSDKEVKVTRLAFGLPMGSSLEYVDGGTLARALAGRQ